MAASTDAAKLFKELQIKTNVVKRLIKEYHSYEKEVEKTKEKIEKMKADPDVDDYTVKKATDVLQVIYLHSFWASDRHKQKFSEKIL